MRKSPYQNPFQTDRWLEGFHGPVQRVETEWIRHIDEITHTKTRSNTFRMIVLFHEDGKKPEEVSFHPGGTTAYPEPDPYEQNGRLTEKRSCDSGGTVRWRWVYEFDPAGRHLTEVLYDAQGEISSREVIHFNAQGEKIGEDVLDSTGEPVHRNEFVYGRSAEGFETVMLTFSPKHELLKRRIYTYDESGRLLDKSIYRGNGLLESRERFAYDAAGNVREAITYQPDGAAGFRYTYRYEYGDRGDWIRRETEVELHRAGGPDHWLAEHTRRGLTYYP